MSPTQPMSGGHPVTAALRRDRYGWDGPGFGKENTGAQACIESNGTPGIGLLQFRAPLVVVVVWVQPDDCWTTAGLGFALVSLGIVTLDAMTLAGC